jgi:mersacidin/lichenicidin family type 2 lantibiotic
MSNVDIIRAWKDEAYRLSLTAEQLAELPANPAGQIELDEADLEEIAVGKNGGVGNTSRLCSNTGSGPGAPGGGIPNRAITRQCM